MAYLLALASADVRCSGFHRGARHPSGGDHSGGDFLAIQRHGAACSAPADSPRIVALPLRPALGGRRRADRRRRGGPALPGPGDRADGRGGSHDRGLRGGHPRRRGDAPGRAPGGLAVLGIALGIGSIVLVSQQTEATSGPGRAGASGLPPGVGIALVSGVLIGFFFLSLARTAPSSGMWPILAARITSVTLFAAAALVRGIPLAPARPALWLALAGGTVDMLANAAYLLAAREGQLSLVVTLSSLYPASTVLLARVLLGERLNARQLGGVGCALAAIVLIVIGGG